MHHLRSATKIKYTFSVSSELQRDVSAYTVLHFYSFSSPLQKMVAVPLGSLYLLITVFQLCLLHQAHGGAYYGHKQPPPQHQPLPQYNDGYPQQQFMGNEMPHLPYGKEGPSLPQYGKELPQLPLQMGKERPLTEGKGEANLL